MDKEKLDKIQRLTGHSYLEIMKMNDKDFFFNITRLLASSLTKDQHDWLDKCRQKYKIGDDQQLIDTLDIFGGKLLK